MTEQDPLSIRTWKRLRHQGRAFEQLASTAPGSTAHTRQLQATIAAQEKFLFHLLTLMEERQRHRRMGEL